MKVLKEVKSRTSEEHSLGLDMESVWRTEAEVTWLSISCVGLSVSLFFFPLQVPLPPPPSNKQECNKNAENQGVDYPGKAVGVRKAFLVVFFSYSYQQGLLNSTVWQVLS